MSTKQPPFTVQDMIMDRISQKEALELKSMLAESDMKVLRATLSLERRLQKLKDQAIEQGLSEEYTQTDYSKVIRDQVEVLITRLAEMDEYGFSRIREVG